MTKKPIKHPLIEAIGELVYLLAKFDNEAIEHLREAADSHTNTNCCWSRYAVARFLDPLVLRQAALRVPATSEPSSREGS